MILDKQPNRAHSNQRRSRAAFTLLEILVVVAIIVILAGVSGVTYMNYLESSKKDIAQVGIAQIEQAVMAWRTKRGEYPPDLNVLVQSIDGEPAAMETKHLIDPWGRAYVYEPQQLHPQTQKPLIFSQGPVMGNANGRITNWSH